MISHAHEPGGGGQIYSVYHFLIGFLVCGISNHHQPQMPWPFRWPQPWPDQYHFPQRPFA